jgi:membrane-associated phospholipid phosphatase
VSRRNTAVVALALFAALAGLVAAGSVTGIDQWAVNHAMPGVRPHGHKPTLAEELVPLLHTNFASALDIATNVVAAPASVLASLLVLLGLRRRVWIAAWLAGTVVEEIGKALLSRPALYSQGVHLVGFDSSYPSGHTIRTIVLAAAVASTWPAARRVAAAWAVAALVLLEVDGWHTPSDIAGGLLLAVGGLGLLRGRAA